MDALKIIARIHSEFPTKFGIPRQSGLVPALRARIVFEPEYRNAEALRGIEAFSHLWLIWDFSEAHQEQWSPTVRPPRLGGNRRMGVFATRSPFRPNPIGLSCVELIEADFNPKNPTLLVGGADLMDGTPIYDIKPYVVYADSYPQARSGFVDTTQWQELEVEIPQEVARQFTSQQLAALRHTLALDPRPHYHNSATKVYGMRYLDRDIHFRVEGNKLTVINGNK